MKILTKRGLGSTPCRTKALKWGRWLINEHLRRNQKRIIHDLTTLKRERERERNTGQLNNVDINTAVIQCYLNYGMKEEHLKRQLVIHRP